MKSVLRRVIQGLGYEVRRRRAVYHPWNPDTAHEPDREFLGVFERAFSLGSAIPGFAAGAGITSKRARCYMLKALLAQMEPLGNVAECGVYRGGSAYILAHYMGQQKRDPQDAQLWLFDSFEGLPAGHPKLDLVLQKGDFGDTSADVVSAHLSGYDFVRVVKGWIPDSLVAVSSELFSFVHVDVDHYQSVLDCCAFFFPRLRAPAAMVFDDYGDPTTAGAKAAVDEFASSVGRPVVPLPTGQGALLYLKQTGAGGRSVGSQE